MRRSQINTIMADAEDFFRSQQLQLPPFAYWDPEELSFNVKNKSCEHIVTHGLGWSVTDFGLGDFTDCGLVVFTSRMGDHAQLSSGRGKLYGEKFLIQRDGQRTPLHYHQVKTEDIVNRSDATFLIELHHANEMGELDANRRLAVLVDGQQREFLPGENVALRAGESLTLEPQVYHGFTARGGDVLAVEISLANDDANDNFFYEPIGVAQEIDEDEPPRHLMVHDYVAHFDP